MVSASLIQELQVILKEDYGVSLTTNQATEIGNSLAQYIEVLTKVNKQAIKKGGN